jgi:hypothetical protein
MLREYAPSGAALTALRLDSAGQVDHWHDWCPRGFQSCEPKTEVEIGHAIHLARHQKITKKIGKLYSLASDSSDPVRQLGVRVVLLDEVIERGGGDAGSARGGRRSVVRSEARPGCCASGCVPRRGDPRSQPTRCGVREGVVADKVSMVEMSGRDRSGGMGDRPRRPLIVVMIRPVPGR